LLEIGFPGELGSERSSRGTGPRDDAVGQLTSSGVHEHQTGCSAQPAATGTGCGIGAGGLADAGRLRVFVAVGRGDQHGSEERSGDGAAGAGGTSSQGLWSASRPSCGRRRGTGFGMTAGDGREPERAYLLGGVDQAGGQDRLVTVKCSPPALLTSRSRPPNSQTTTPACATSLISAGKADAAPVVAELVDERNSSDPI